MREFLGGRFKVGQEITATFSAMDDRRKHPRIPTLKAGQIEFNRRLIVVECVVRNMSDGGACLQVEDAGWLPAMFDLAVPIDGVKRACRVAWRSADKLGVAYL
jgi:hypothetical protein